MRSEDYKREINIAWAAGLFEGEGCIYFRYEKDKYLKLKLVLVTTDKDVIIKFHQIIGYGSIKQIAWRKFTTKTTWEWAINSREEAKLCLNLLVPYLGERRKQKAKELLKVIDLRNSEPRRATLKFSEETKNRMRLSQQKRRERERLSNA